MKKYMPIFIMLIFSVCLAGCYLIGSDDKSDTEESTLDEANESLNSKPIADCGEDQFVNIGDFISLDGSGSSDPDGDDLRYTWSIINAPDGSRAEISGASSPSASFTPDMKGTYDIKLIVNDGEMDSDPDTITLTGVYWNMVTGFDEIRYADSFDNKVYIAESGNNNPEVSNRIVIMDWNGQILDTFGEYGDGNGQFKLVTALKVWKDEIFILDNAYNNRIMVFDLDGSYVRQWSITESESWNNAHGMEITEQGGRDYVLIGIGCLEQDSENEEQVSLIRIYDAETGVMAQQKDLSEDISGDVHDVVCDADNNTYVVVRPYAASNGWKQVGNTEGCIHKYDDSFTHTKIITFPAEYGWSDWWPGFAGGDPMPDPFQAQIEGNELFVSNPSNTGFSRGVYVFDLDGNFKRKIGSDPQDENDYGYYDRVVSTSGIAVEGENLLMADYTETCIITKIRQ